MAERERFDEDPENEASDIGGVSEAENLTQMLDNEEIDTDDDDLEGGFLNMPVNDALRAIFEGDDHNEDEFFYGFDDAFPQVPDPNWSDVENVFPIYPYDKDPGRTMDNAPGDTALSYFELFFDNDFVRRIMNWTN